MVLMVMNSRLKRKVKKARECAEERQINILGIIIKYVLKINFKYSLFKKIKLYVNNLKLY
jgi:hypothetical protein